MVKLTRKIRDQGPEKFNECWEKNKNYLELRWKMRGFLHIFDWIFDRE